MQICFNVFHTHKHRSMNVCVAISLRDFGKFMFMSAFSGRGTYLITRIALVLSVRKDCIAVFCLDSFTPPHFPIIAVKALHPIVSEIPNSHA